MCSNLNSKQCDITIENAVHMKTENFGKKRQQILQV